MNVGAVGSMRNVKNAIGVARHVLENTQHTLLVGDQATAFAVRMGFKNESLSTAHSNGLWHQWKQNRCQPNFWTVINKEKSVFGLISNHFKLFLFEIKNVQPDPLRFCGPYEPNDANSVNSHRIASNAISSNNHDTIGMIAIDANGDIAAATSTNGVIYKIPG